VSRELIHILLATAAAGALSVVAAAALSKKIENTKKKYNLFITRTLN